MNENTLKSIVLDSEFVFLFVDYEISPILSFSFEELSATFGEIQIVVSDSQKIKKGTLVPDMKRKS